MLLEKLTVTQLGKKFSVVYGTWRFVLMFTRSLTWARFIHSTPFHSVSLRFILTLSSYVSLSSAWSLPIRFSDQNSACISLPSHACPCHLLDLAMLTIFGYECQLWNSSLCIFLHPPTTYALVGPNIPLSTLFNFSVYTPLVWQTMFQTHTNNRWEWSFIYLIL